MTIWLYSIIRDEAPILPYLLRHYTPWVDRLIFYDGGSVDGSRELLAKAPKVELRDWAGSPGLVDDEFHVFANQQWHEARGKADWVIWVDADEFLYFPLMPALLSFYLGAGVEVPQVAGYTMVSHSFPTTQGQIYEEVRTGFPDHIWGKPAIFQPHIPLIVNMGRHSVNNDAYRPVRSKTAEIKLLHYRCLGLEYLRARHARNWARVPARCREMNLGSNTQPGWKENHGVAWFEEKLKGELEVVV
jgi:hypothetical protein